MLLHQENAPVHKSVVTIGAVFELVDHHPYSPDMASFFPHFAYQQSFLFQRPGLLPSVNVVSIRKD